MKATATAHPGGRGRLRNGVMASGLTCDDDLLGRSADDKAPRENMAGARIGGKCPRLEAQSLSSLTRERSQVRATVPHDVETMELCLGHHPVRCCSMKPS